MRITEKNFITRLKKHDEKALLYVIDKYGGLLKSIVLRHLYLSKEVQEECLDDILLAIWENIAHFHEEKGTFLNWIAGIAKYKSIDYLRKQSREIQCENIVDIEVIEERDALHIVLEQEISDGLERMLSCLNKQDREVFLKLFYEEKDMDEISRETGMEKPVLYNRISRGKQKIRNTYSEVGRGRNR